jgi:hypothetical protein
LWQRPNEKLTYYSLSHHFTRTFSPSFQSSIKVFCYLLVGAAGLYCGILLAEAGHTVTIFEASDRAGGRINTYRDPKNPSKYIGELGAMRFPLDMHPYLDSMIRQRYKLNITSFFNFNENIYTQINGIFAIKEPAHKNSNIFQFNTSESEGEKVRRCFCIHKYKCHGRNIVECC